MIFEIVSLLAIVVMAVVAWFHTPSTKIYPECGGNCNQGRNCNCVMKDKRND